MPLTTRKKSFTRMKAHGKRIFPLCTNTRRTRLPGRKSRLAAACGRKGREYRPVGFYVEFDRVCDMGFNMVFRIREDAGCQG